MSYDVWIGDKSFNYTSNLSKLFYDHIPEERSRGGIWELEGLTGKQAALVLADALERIQRSRYSSPNDAAFTSKYDAPNGWGSTIGAILFLASIMAACFENPRKRVGLWA